MKILIVQTAFIGDVILSLPLIHTLSKNISFALVDILTVKEPACLLTNDPYINNIIIYDKRGKDKGIFRFLRLIKEIKSRNYDIAIIPNFASFRSALLAYMAGIKERIGFEISPFSFLYTQKVVYNPFLHQVERNFQLLKPIKDLESDSFIRKINIFLKEEDVNFAKEFLAKSQKKPRLIGINPASYWPTKIWPSEYVAELCDRIISELDADVILFSEEKYKPLIEEIKIRMKHTPIDATGVFNISQLAACISLCNVLITTDSGPMHIAAGVGTKILSIFGPTTKRLGFYPYTKKAILIEKELDCKPCSSHGPQRCPKLHHNCMRRITPNEVFETLLQLI